MVTISSLAGLTAMDILQMGHYGYTSAQAYVPVQQPEGDQIGFAFRLETLATPKQKTWHTNETELEELNEEIAAGHSFAAYENGRLTGFIIAEKRDWNNTCYISQLTVAASQRRKGTGAQLMAAMIAHAGTLNVRLLELETQNTNVPAVNFYLKHGFQVSGVNLRLYDPVWCPGEVAFYMTYTI
ncbi:GNAT family N-acetyltransferase [Chitinophaga qingshengii]|uniref:GNAT family N-acetyltransferase n=1 Tax=Chitinophaga qingshengii TaxID=1569794 RepID=A0ABR7TR85_9BACT|nr:GNAT family N-acetyltransferase [Chitinophaga qingshengii]MBC9932993.1 GNAT family N-acetyltransferase [Chitinophaga qingshengii]